jgi:hypothetical protein
MICFKGMAKEAKLMSEWMSKENKLIVSCDTLLPREILECRVIREATFHSMVIIVQHYVPSAPIAAPVIWDATAVPEASNPSWYDLQNIFFSYCTKFVYL